LKICCVKFPLVFVISMVCQNFLPSCQFHSNRLWSVGTEGCLNTCLISSSSCTKPSKTELLLPSGIIVCVRIVLKLSGTQAELAFGGGEWGDRPRPRASGLRSSL
jgi:hypothetical protein